MGLGLEFARPAWPFAASFLGCAAPHECNEMSADAASMKRPVDSQVGFFGCMSFQSDLFDVPLILGLFLLQGLAWAMGP